MSPLSYLLLPNFSFSSLIHFLPPRPANGGLSHLGEFWKRQDHPQQQLKPLWQVPPHPHSPVSRPKACTLKQILLFRSLPVSSCSLVLHLILSAVLPDSGVVVGTSLSKYLLEKSRVVFQVSRLNEACCVCTPKMYEDLFK